jgi:predicted DNA-binding transcriptional regulator AlpA
MEKVSSRGFARVSKAMGYFGIGRSAFYDRVKRGLLPGIVHIGGAAVLLEDEMTEVAIALAAGLPDSDVFTLVQRQITERARRAVALRKAA